jgi:hypothetical protein
MNYDELLAKKKQWDEMRWQRKLNWGYRSYKKYRRLKHFKVYVPEWDKKIEEEQIKLMSDFKLRKQYSKNYQVVELEVTGDLSEYDTMADWLDNKLRIEMNNIPSELLVKDNAGSKKPNYYERKETTPKQYTNNKQSYSRGGSEPNAYGKSFGSAKQWAIIEKNEQRLLDEQGVTGQDISSPEQLKELIGLLMQR